MKQIASLLALTVVLALTSDTRAGHFHRAAVVQQVVVEKVRVQQIVQPVIVQRQRIVVDHGYQGYYAAPVQIQAIAAPQCYQAAPVQFRAPLVLPQTSSETETVTTTTTRSRSVSP